MGETKALYGRLPRIQRLLKKSARAAISTRVYLECSRLLDRLVLRRQLRTNVRDAPFSALVIATAGRGNIGDQAMLNAVLENIPGHVAIILSARNALAIPPAHVDRTHVKVLPSLLMGAPIGRVTARRAFIQLLLRSRQLLIIGADIMDGSYDRREAVLRYHLAQLAQRVSVPTRILGFSWSDRADPLAVAEASRIAATVELLVRDPHSVARMRRSGIEPLQPVSDVVFSLTGTSELPPELDSWLHDMARHIEVVVLNTSGLLAARHPHIRHAYVEIARSILDLGCALIVLPHVLRLGDDDLAEAKVLSAVLGRRNDLFVIEFELTPEQVAAVARRVKAVVTGRMHLAILSMNGGTPAAIISSQGKVSGLLELAGLAEFELAPDDALASNAVRAVQRILEDTSVREELEAKLESLRTLSQLNFD